MTSKKTSQPSDCIVLKWNPTFSAEWSKKFSDCQKYIDNQVLRYNSKYIPMQTGALDRSGQVGTVIGSGEVVYQSPYARYLYYGKVMRDKNGRAFYGEAPKFVTDEELHYHGEPQRGKLWFERMKAAHKDAILKGAGKYFSK